MKYDVTIIGTEYRFKCNKCENEWLGNEESPCPKCDRENFLRWRYKQMGHSDEEIERIIKKQKEEE